MALVLFVLVGSIAARGRPDNGVYYKGTSEVVGALVVGAFVAGFYLCVIGSIGQAIASRRGRNRRWRRSITTFPVLLITLLLLVGSAAGRASQHQAAVEKARPNPRGTLTERERANLDAQNWSKSRRSVMLAARATFQKAPEFLKVFTANGNSSRVRAMALQLERQFESEQQRWRVLPASPLSDLQQVDGQVERALSLAGAAYADYVAGLRANLAAGTQMSQDKGAIALLDSGDTKLRRAARLLDAVGRRLVALDSEYSLR